MSKCETARGKVHDVHHHMKDGDYKFGLDVQKKYKDLLNKGNNKKRVGGNLIVEIVPKDRKSSDVYLPEKGEDVRVWGAWVKDKPNGWNEIHPVYCMQKWENPDYQDFANQKDKWCRAMAEAKEGLVQDNQEQPPYRYVIDPRLG